MKIIIDAMGGDHAPEEIVKGAVLARKQLGYDLILVGREADIRRCLAADRSAPVPARPGRLPGPWPVLPLRSLPGRRSPD